MLSIISKQTREKNKQARQKTHQKKQTNNEKKKHKKKHKKNKLCTYQMEPTFGDRKQFQTQNMVDIYIYIYIFERLLNLRQKEN